MRVAVKDSDGNVVGYGDIDLKGDHDPLEVAVTIVDDDTANRIRRHMLGGLSIGPAWLDEPQHTPLNDLGA